MRLVLLSLVLFAACDSSKVEDVVGPFTGQTRRFVIDSIDIPWEQMGRRYSADLDGDGILDNSVARTLSLLGSDDITRYGNDMIAAGWRVGAIEITADDVATDPTVGVRFTGPNEQRSADLGGSLEDGWFRSNRTRYTHVPVTVFLRLPVFEDADPLAVQLDGVELDLTPDGRGGFDGAIRGVIPHDAAVDAATRGIQQMIETNLSDHLSLFHRIEQRPTDWSLSNKEVRSYVAAYLYADIKGPTLEGVSIGVGAHFSPCEAGDCAGTPMFTSDDRVRDGREAGVDCGVGGSRGCAGGTPCTEDRECESGTCSDGLCASTSCSDGKQDGFEVGVDCGEYCGVGCPSPSTCWSELDCASQQCGEPCPEDALFCWDGGPDACVP